MALESDHCENSEMYCTIEDFLILKELQSSFSYKLQMKSWTETVLYSLHEVLKSSFSKDELKQKTYH